MDANLEPRLVPTSDARARQLAWIDQKINKAAKHAATSNRARGAVRQWTQRKLAMMTASDGSPCGTNAKAEEAEQLLVAGAPEPLRAAVEAARDALSKARQYVLTLHHDCLPTDRQHAMDLVQVADLAHETALRRAIDWLP
jgi:hypothetical protein